MNRIAPFVLGSMALISLCLIGLYVQLSRHSNIETEKMTSTADAVNDSTNKNNSTTSIKTDGKACELFCNELSASNTPDGRKFIANFASGSVFSIDYPDGFTIQSLHDQWSLVGGVMMFSKNDREHGMYFSVGKASDWRAKYEGGGGLSYDKQTGKFLKHDFDQIYKQIEPVLLGKTKSGQNIFAFSGRDTTFYPGSYVIIFDKGRAVSPTNSASRAPMIVEFSDFGIGSGSILEKNMADKYFEIIKSTEIK